MSFKNYFFFILIFLGSCKSLKTSKPTHDDIMLFQNGKEIILDKNQTLRIEKSKFSFRFFHKKFEAENNQFNDIRIAVFLDKSEFEKTKVGMKIKDTYCFFEGTGVAASENNFYESIFINDESHHYLYYENESDRRLDLLKKEGEILKLEFPISSIHLQGVYYPIEEFPKSDLFFMIFIDRNSNKIVDENELHQLALNLK